MIRHENGNEEKDKKTRDVVERIGEKRHYNKSETIRQNILAKRRIN